MQKESDYFEQLKQGADKEFRSINKDYTPLGKELDNLVLRVQRMRGIIDKAQRAREEKPSFSMWVALNLSNHLGYMKDDVKAIEKQMEELGL